MFTSIKFKLFLGLSLILFLLNLLVMNDWNTVWNGAEAAMLWNSAAKDTSVFLPEILLSFLIRNGITSDFALRIPGVLILISALAAFYWWGRKIFGKNSALIISLVMGSSFLIPNFAKVAVADTWLLAFQLGALISLFFFLKAPTLVRRLIFYTLFGVSIWLHPLSSLLFFTGLSIFLYFLHPSGKNILLLNPWLFAIIITPILHFSGLLVWKNPAYILAWGNSSLLRFAGYSLLGVLPFTPFLAGALRDIFSKFKKQEELTLILFPWLTISFLAQSPLFHAALAFLIGKQMLGWFDKNFPNRSIIRAIALLHLVFVFCLGIIALIGGFIQFEATGYRAAVLFIGIYWALSFLLVLGLYLVKDWKLTIGASVLCGLISTGIFWTRVMPVLEQERNLPKRVMEKAESMNQSGDDPIVVFVPKHKKFSNLPWYASRISNDLTIFQDTSLLEKTIKTNPQHIFIFEKYTLSNTPVIDSTQIISGRNDGFKMLNIQVLKDGDNN